MQVDHGLTVLLTSADMEIPWTEVGEQLLVQELWDKALPVLTAHLPHEEWETIEAAYIAVRRAETSARGLQLQGARQWDEGHNALVTDPLNALQRAKSVLGQLASNDSWKRRVLTA